jgi:hypothetical protein
MSEASRAPSNSLAPRGERVTVRDICAARLSVAPHILILGEMWSLTRRSKTNVGLSPHGARQRFARFHFCTVSARVPIPARYNSIPDATIWRIVLTAISDASSPSAWIPACAID